MPQLALPDARIIHANAVRRDTVLQAKESARGRLEGKVVLISGGARGQSATEAKLFAREGAQVVFGDVLNDEGRQVETEIRVAGGEATYVHLDVTSEDDWREVVGTAVNELVASCRERRNPLN
jgi:enoyl-[acyl-carrier-protein] reductase (NADH)